MQNTVINLQGVSKTFNPRTKPVRAVNNLDLTIHRGEVVALLGPNGAGKTTTIDMVLGMTDPTSGTVTTFGQSPTASVKQGKVSALMQTGGLPSGMTVAEVLSTIAGLHGCPERIPMVAERAGVTGFLKRKVQKCSGGEQQRLRYAMSLLPQPELLILDEPTAGMDVNAQHEFWQAIREDAGRGTTIVFATHYLREADEYSDRVVIINNGELVADGTPEEISNTTPTRIVGCRISGISTEADLPGNATIAHIREAATAAQIVVGTTEVRAGKVSFAVSDSDMFARILLDTPGVEDLTITGGNIESAFISLTGEEK